MGCVNSTYTPPRNRNRTGHIDKFKDQYAFKPIIHNKNHPSKHVQAKTKKRVVIVNTITVAEEGERVDVARDINDDKSEEENKKKMNAIYDIKVEENEWPKWLVNNISQNVLATLIRKTADSYEKLGKVSNYSNYTNHFFMY